jgi:teichuronic acid biosynthesis glycosyltransferase TuaC
MCLENRIFTMRILFFSSIFPQPGNPTRGIFCWQLCQALAATCEVRVISPWPWLARLRHRGSKEAPPELSGPRFNDLHVDYPQYFYPPGIFRNAYHRFMARSVRRSMRRDVAEFRPDCLLSYWAHPDGAVAAQAAQAIGAASAVIVGGSDILLLPQSRLRRRCVVAALQANDAVLAVGRDLQTKAIALGLPAEKVHVVHQGVDTDMFFPGSARTAREKLGLAPNGNVLLWVGNMVPVKGLDTLLKACTLMRDRGEQFHLYLVGDGPLRKELERDCQSRGLSDVVQFVGARLPRDLPDWYRAADLTVLPSRSEGLPNVLRESLACGKPFVASDVGSIRDLAAGSTKSRLVMPGNASALADAIRDTLHSPRENCLTSFQLESWFQSAAKVLGILESLIARRRAKGATDSAHLKAAMAPCSPAM